LTYVNLLSFYQGISLPNSGYLTRTAAYRYLSNRQHENRRPTVSKETAIQQLDSLRESPDHALSGCVEFSAGDFFSIGM
jgi:hypothetical protein